VSGIYLRTPMRSRGQLGRFVRRCCPACLQASILSVSDAEIQILLGSLAIVVVMPCLGDSDSCSPCRIQRSCCCLLRPRPTMETRFAWRTCARTSPLSLRLDRAADPCPMSAARVVIPDSRPSAHPTAQIVRGRSRAPIVSPVARPLHCSCVDRQG
jgi:hypothetical protein